MDLSSETNQPAETSKPEAAPARLGLNNAAFFRLTTCKRQELPSPCQSWKSRARNRGC